MKEQLNKIRAPETNIKISAEIIRSVLILLSGSALGIFSKWLDNTAINDEIRWQRILGILDLRNVFSAFAIWLFVALAVAVYSKTPLRAGLNVFLFFSGMCISYHLYTVFFSGFNPKAYMMIWYALTLLSPLLAFVCWYGKGKTNISLIIDVLILTVMMYACFSIGFWYFDFNGVINALIFAASLIVLYSTPKRTAAALLAALVLAFAARIFF